MPLVVPHVRNLNVYIEAQSISYLSKEQLAVVDIGVVQKLLELYPNFESLVVKIDYEMSLDENGDEKVSWDRHHFVTNLVRAVKSLEGVRQKGVYLTHWGSIHLNLAELAEVDGRGREVEELGLEMVCCDEVFVRLACSNGVWERDTTVFE
jgi:hypothetical protein